MRGIFKKQQPLAVLVGWPHPVPTCPDVFECGYTCQPIYLQRFTALYDRLESKLFADDSRTIHPIKERIR